MPLYYKSIDNLKANRARLAMIDKQIPQLRNLIDKLRNDACIKTTKYDLNGYRHAEGAHSDPTATHATEECSKDVLQLQEDIHSLLVERYRLRRWIEEAETALSFLSDRDRLIVELRCIDKLSWGDVVDGIFERTGRLYSESATRARFDKAMQSIKPFFGIDETRYENKQHAYYGSCGRLMDAGMQNDNRPDPPNTPDPADDSNICVLRDRETGKPVTTMDVAKFWQDATAFWQ